MWLSKPAGLTHQLPVRVEIADSFFKRARGLLGYTQIPDDFLLWFPNTFCIHTFGMAFAIDCFFVNKKGLVTRIFENVKPSRIRGVFQIPCHVGEMNAFRIKALGIEVGDTISLKRGETCLL